MEEEVGVYSFESYVISNYLECLLMEHFCFLLLPPSLPPSQSPPTLPHSPHLPPSQSPPSSPLTAPLPSLTVPTSLPHSLLLPYLTSPPPPSQSPPSLPHSLSFLSPSQSPLPSLPLSLTVPSSPLSYFYSHYCAFALPAPHYMSTTY